MRLAARQTPLPVDHPSLRDELDTVKQYFEWFNRGEYHQLSMLFAPEGCLHPPFEDPVIGQDAIMRYLDEAADGMQAEPLTIATQTLQQGRLQVEVKGKVTALVFKVNVMWRFVIAPDEQIESVTVDLLASLQELLNIRPA